MEFPPAKSYIRNVFGICYYSYVKDELVRMNCNSDTEEKLLLQSLYRKCRRRRMQRPLWKCRVKLRFWVRQTSRF